MDIVAAENRWLHVRHRLAIHAGILLLDSVLRSLGRPETTGAGLDLAVTFLFSILLWAGLNSLASGLLVGLLWTPVLALRGWGVAPPSVTPALSTVPRGRAITAHIVCSILYVFPAYLIGNGLLRFTDSSLFWVTTAVGFAIVTGAVLAGYARYDLEGYALEKRRTVLVYYGITLAAYFGLVLLVPWLMSRLATP